MTSFEVLFRVKHRGALLELSERHPSMRVYMGCNRVNEVLEVEWKTLRTTALSSGRWGE